MQEEAQVAAMEGLEDDEAFDAEEQARLLMFAQQLLEDEPSARDAFQARDAVDSTPGLTLEDDSSDFLPGPPIETVMDSTSLSPADAAAAAVTALASKHDERQVYKRSHSLPELHRLDDSEGVDSDMHLSEVYVELRPLKDLIKQVPLVEQVS